MFQETSQEALVLLLDRLLKNGEDEVTEFKSVPKDYSTNEIGSYFSALSNEARLRGAEEAWLVFGIDDKTRKVVGTAYRQEPGRLKGLLHQISEETQPKSTFRNIFELNHADGRVLLFQIPPAPIGTPVSWKGHYYARAGESLTALSLDKLDAIRQQREESDWTSQILPGASLDDLDSDAIAFARKQFSEKHKGDSFYEDIASWNTKTFLNKAKLAIGGKLTRAAIILLGKPESVHFLSPSVAKITWCLVDNDGIQIDYKHFEPPFLLAVDQVFAKIRNVSIRALPDGTLFPVEISQYDSWVFREALHNCIAHQDYRLNSSIVVTEYSDHIQFSNAGAFIPGTLENVLNDDGRPRYYPNRQLADAMVELKMIDTIGSGIKRMFSTQKKRFMPMPDYIISENAVSVVLEGKILDARYTALLMKNGDLSLWDIILLDKVQKKRVITKDEAKYLRKKGLIEGRYPKVYPAASIAVQTHQVGAYLDRRGYDDDFYIRRILDFISTKGFASRAELDECLKPHMPSSLSDEQKRKKISNLLSVKMVSRSHLIVNRGSKRYPVWKLTEKGKELCKKEKSSCKNRSKK